MAYVTLGKSSLKHNYAYLSQLFDAYHIQWAPVAKMLCGNKAYLQYSLSLGDNRIGDARLQNLKTIKSLSPEADTVYIKPPAKRSIEDVVAYADVSFNPEYVTIEWLSEESVRRQKTHQIIIMIELGDLREGIMGESLVGFYQKVFELPNIEVIGIGANLSCLSGIMPSKDK